MDISEELNNALFERKMKQKKLADTLNITPVTVNRWAKGKTSPRKGDFEAILKALDMSREEFFKDRRHY
jgi:transcriptional regulator with XRE-family HTH domain